MDICLFFFFTGSLAYNPSSRVWEITYFVNRSRIPILPLTIE